MLPKTAASTQLLLHTGHTDVVNSMSGQMGLLGKQLLLSSTCNQASKAYRVYLATALQAPNRCEADGLSSTNYCLVWSGLTVPQKDAAASLADTDLSIHASRLDS